MLTTSNKQSVWKTILMTVRVVVKNCDDIKVNFQLMDTK